MVAKKLGSGGLLEATAWWVGGLILFGILGLGDLQALLFRDGDTVRHIATGDLIRISWRVPTEDPWAFTTTNCFWYNPSWLWNVGISYMNTWGGIAALMRVGLGLVLMVFILPILVACRWGASLPLALGMGLVGSLVLLSGAALRPQLITLLLVPIAMGLLLALDSHFRWFSWKLGSFFLVVGFWANSHGGFPILFSFLGCYGLGSLMKGEWKKLGQWMGVGVIAFGVTWLNPLGPKVYIHLVDFFSGHPIQALIHEWQPWAPEKQWVFVPLMAFFLLAFMVEPEMRRHPLAWAALVWLVLGIQSVRHFYVFAPMGIMGAAWGFTRFVSRVSQREKRPSWFLRNIPWRINQQGAGLGVLMVGGILGVVTPSELKGNYALVEETCYLKNNLAGARVLNFYNYGSLVLFATRGECQVWIDDRAETLFPREVQADVVRLQKEPSLVLTLADTYEADVILFPKEGEVAKVVKGSPEWQAVYHGPTASLFVRRGWRGELP